jgi:hypothetical protein
LGGVIIVSATPTFILAEAIITELNMITKKNPDNLINIPDFIIQLLK